MSRTELCRNCFQRSLSEVNPEKRLWKCSGCDKAYVRIKDGEGARWFPADASGRALGAGALSTRSGWIYAHDGSSAEGGKTSAPAIESRVETQENVRPDLDELIAEGTTRLAQQRVADAQLVDFDNPESVRAYEELQANRLTAFVQELTETLSA